jgi:hypothetical protein
LSYAAEQETETDEDGDKITCDVGSIYEAAGARRAAERDADEQRVGPEAGARVRGGLCKHYY